MLYSIGCITVILVGISFVAMNVCLAASVDSGSRAIDIWMKTGSFVQALVITGLLIYFVIRVI